MHLCKYTKLLIGRLLSHGVRIGVANELAIRNAYRRLGDERGAQMGVLLRWLHGKAIRGYAPQRVIVLRRMVRTGITGPALDGDQRKSSIPLAKVWPVRHWQ